MDLDVAEYRDQRERRELAALGTGVLRGDGRWRRVADLPPAAGGPTVRIVPPGPVERVVVRWYRPPHVLTPNLRRVKIAAVRARLTGRAAHGAAVYVSAEGVGAEAAVRRLPAASGPPDRAADRVSGVR